MIRVALPRGDLRDALAPLLDAADFRVEGYREGSRSYRFDVDGRPGVVARVFSERDIPIQVALGQYDLGITRRAWVDELLVRYPHDSIVPLQALDVGAERIVLAGAAGLDLARLAAGVVHVATEYPNLATRFLNRMRVPDYRLFDVWGEAQAWPPEDADLAVVSDGALRSDGPDAALEVLAAVHRGGAWLIGNRRALAERGLAQALDPLLRLPAGPAGEGPLTPPSLGLTAPPLSGRRRVAARDRAAFRIAVPDGHSQRHAFDALAAAGIAFEGYETTRASRRPRSDIEGVEVKVIRPQDMPGAVALGCFDLALTGRDWLAAHRAAFPASPVVELVDLGRARYQLGAVVSEDLPAETIEEAVAYWRRDDPQRPLRIASEYVALADHYARERRLGRYRVIPISGASEGFVPDDAEILLEGSETGTTLRANRLRMIDVVMESTNCAVGAADAPPGRRGELRAELVERLRAAAEMSA